MLVSITPRPLGFTQITVNGVSRVGELGSIVANLGIREDTTCSISAQGKNSYRGPVGVFPKTERPYDARFVLLYTGFPMSRYRAGGILKDRVITYVRAQGLGFTDIADSDIEPPVKHLTFEIRGQNVYE